MWSGEVGTAEGIECYFWCRKSDGEGEGALLGAKVCVRGVGGAAGAQGLPSLKPRQQLCRPEHALCLDASLSQSLGM